MSPRTLVFIVFCAIGSLASATPLGRTETANVLSVNGQPAICLPDGAKGRFAVGWVALTESYARNAGSWGLALKEGRNPLVLKSGECFPYGMVPDAYALEGFGAQEHILVLENNKTYVFRLSSALLSADVYEVVFRVCKAPSGEMRFLQYPRLSNGRRVAPLCNGRGVENISE